MSLLPSATKALHSSHIKSLTFKQKSLLQAWCYDVPVEETQPHPTFCCIIKSYVLQQSLGLKYLSAREYQAFTAIFTSSPSLTHDLIVFRGVKPRWKEEFYHLSLIDEPYPVSTSLTLACASTFAEAKIILVYYLPSGYHCLDITGISDNEEEEILHCSLMGWRVIARDKELLAGYELLFLVQGETEKDEVRLQAMKEQL